MSIRLSEKHGVNPMLLTCFFCCRESSGVALLGRLPADKEAPREGIMDFTPCKQCEEIMEHGIILIGVKDGEMEKVEAEKELHDRKVEHGRSCSTSRRDNPLFIPNPYRTGFWVAMSEGFIRRTVETPELRDSLLRGRWSFIEQSTIDQMGLADFVKTESEGKTEEQMMAEMRERKEDDSA